MVLILQFVNMVYYIDSFVYIEESLHPWDKSQLIIVYVPFNVLDFAYSIRLTASLLPSKSPAYFSSAKSLQSCPTLCDPIDGSPPGSSVPGIFQARILEWVAISFSNA